MSRALPLFLGAFLSLPLRATSQTSPQVPILAYHEVDPVPERGWAVSTEDFEEQMQ